MVQDIYPTSAAAGGVDPFDLTGKVALLTGSTRGMGLAAAQLFADHAARVVLVGRNAEGCAAAAQEVNARFPEPRALGVACNIGHEEDRLRLMETVLAEWGQVDILLCNASLNIWVGPVTELDEGVLRKTLDVNVVANHALMKLVLPGMVERGWGRIVTTTSVVGSVFGSAVDSAYAASKAALGALTKCVAVEHGANGIRANVIAPGTFRTEMARSLWESPEHMAVYEAHNPVPRVGEPQEYAGLALLLCSDGAGYLNGQTIALDGGYTVAWRT
jgi:NAD(P)-dependent dehydrogenase (short-subunit alcohol dehydrogenase family)